MSSCILIIHPLRDRAKKRKKKTKKYLKIKKKLKKNVCKNISGYNLIHRLNFSHA